MMSGTLRGIFFIIIVLCLLAMVLYTQNLVSQLREESRGIVEFYAQTVQRIASEEMAPEALGWFFENVTLRTNFPLILADQDGNPTSWKDIGISETDNSPETVKKIRRILDQMKRENAPVAITHNDQVISYLFYGDSKLIIRLVFLPYVTIAGMGLLVLVAFLGFSSIKRSEQRFIWVGMAKETAHQLGTPISSLMGWQEMLKLSPDLTPERIRAIAGDMETDIQRLQKVAARFSQIGSQAALAKQDIHAILYDVMAYFQRRLPHAGKEILLVESFGQVPAVPINRDLFEWAIENLIKNAIDAVKKKNGVIEIITGSLPENPEKLFIDVRDNGIGITAKRRHDIFKAGFSTKKRGWGLGLNLAKRIIEDNHYGKLFIKETHPGKGTTMRIVL